jgi:uncharacterized membrane protein YidH (DUF202 family)
MAEFRHSSNAKNRKDDMETSAMSHDSNPQAPPNAQQDSVARLVADLSRYALVRTAFSSERSLMAWIRSFVSLYTLGFSLATFTDHLQKRSGSSGFASGTRRLSLLLICLGLASLAFAVVAHVSRLRKMTELGLPKIARSSLPITASTLLLGIGLITLINLVLKWFL